jgi:hypothetical protein
MYASWSCPQQGGFIKKTLFKCGFKNCKKKEKIVRMERALGRCINCSLMHLGLYRRVHLFVRMKTSNK